MVLNVKTKKVNINNSYDIVIEDNLFNELEKYIKFPTNTLIITDYNVPQNFIDIICSKAKNSYVYKIKPGEDSKTIDSYLEATKILIDNKFTRKDLVIALGGGVVGDLAGFVASTYKRGISFINIPTTTLSMIDSSIGGKVAVNYNGIKNIVGAFYMPKKVLISLNTLESLDKRHYNNGLMEALKAGLIYDKDLYELFKHETLNIKEIIIKALMVKKKVVEKDPLEMNLRKILNFGHTIGHAIESQNFNSVFHGEAVAYGMLYFLNPELKEEVKTIIERIIGKIEYKLDKNQTLELISNDKKATDNGIDVVIVEKIGTTKVVNYKLEEIMRLLEGEL